jgi:hypothetical protein
MTSIWKKISATLIAVGAFVDSIWRIFGRGKK